MQRHRASVSAAISPTVSSAIVSAIVATVLLGSGCSISNSSETLSDSLSSPFDWSSDSSDSSSGGDSAYRQDVSDYTVAFARNGGNLDAFRMGVRQLAEHRGIANWEDDATTCASIGLGLRLAELDLAAAEHFGEDLLGANERGQGFLRAGYASIP
jgi:hypothetical protein